MADMDDPKLAAAMHDPDLAARARAAAEERWPALNPDDEAMTYPRSTFRELARGGFVAGATWAAQQNPIRALIGTVAQRTRERDEARAKVQRVETVLAEWEGENGAIPHALRRALDPAEDWHEAGSLPCCSGTQALPQDDEGGGA